MDHNAFILDSNSILYPMKKWQSTIDLLAEIFKAPAAFIVQRGKGGFQVAIASAQESNPYDAGGLIPEETNIFCKKVVTDREPLYVPDATQDCFWDTNPEVRDDGFKSYYGMPIYWPDGDAFGTICVMDFEVSNYSEDYKSILRHFRDVIELDLVRVEQTIIREQASAAINHDLRTPLNAIMGYAEAITNEIQGPVGNEKYKDFAENILKSSQHLLTLVDNMFDLSILHGYQIVLEESDIYLCDLLKDASSMVRPQMKAKNIRFEIDEKTSPIHMSGDAVRLKQLFLNLLNNAMKFTHSGGSVTVSMEITDDNIEVIVSDTGVGMSENDMTRISEPIPSLQRKGTAGERGTGLGLSIVQGFANLHGGKFNRCVLHWAKGLILSFTYQNHAWFLKVHRVILALDAATSF